MSQDAGGYNCAKCGGMLPSRERVYFNKRRPIEFLCSLRCQIERRKDPK